MKGGSRSIWLLVVALALPSVVSCGSRRPAAKTEAPTAPLRLEPACDLAPAAGVSWLVDVKPRAIAEIPDLIPAIARVLPEERLQKFTSAHGGVDLRQVKELCVARYRHATLSIARVPLDPEKVAAAFETLSTQTVTRTFLSQSPPVVRLTGEVDKEPERLVLFGRETAVVERGDNGPLRAAEAFAFGRLKKAAPALRGSALKRAAEILGDEPPVRVFAPGPFEGEAARGLGGLLGAATAAGASAKWAGRGSNLAVRVVLTGAWGDDAAAAANRFASAVQVLGDSSMGHLFGLHRPVEGPTVHGEIDALVLDATIDGAALAEGIHDAVDADVAEIMRR